MRNIYFYDMWMESQRVNISHLFLTVLIISRKLPAIARLLAHWLLPNPYLVCLIYAVELVPFLRGSKLELFFKDRRPWICSLFGEWPFSPKIHQDDPEDPTHQMLCLFCWFQKDLLAPIPTHKVKTTQTTIFIWVYFPQRTRQLRFTIKNLPRCFNEINNLWWCKDTSLPIFSLLMIQN